LGSLLWFFDVNKRSRSELLVLNYHGTQKKFLQNFEKQIIFLKKHFDFVSPNQFESLISAGIQVSGKKVLITFDDGIRNNKYIIEVLTKYNISAIFFIVPGFVDTPIFNQKGFFLKNIRPVVNKFIDLEEEDFQSLTWVDVVEIGVNHQIGCHSYSHSMSIQSSKKEIENEVVNSKIRIEKMCGLKIDSFCSINNTTLSVNCLSFESIVNKYNYHYTTFPGNNNFGEKYLIRRINIESHWLLGAVKLALSPIDWIRWRNKFKSFRNEVLN
jgi:peptidoglycan/xylan/chitin deacetylase (PgdA/CDA1 family)